MIKHTLKDDQIHISIPNKDFSYRIPVKKLGNKIDWKIGEKGTEGIVIAKVSTWTLQLFTKKVTEEKYVLQFQNIIKEYCPDNTIDWHETLLAVKIQNKYNWLISKNKTADKKLSEQEIISILNEKY